ncbi:thylakoid lumenal 29 kDa protein, chloroplastic [Lactuca sativa]|uniref:thylakoid lumenal 29 kDa protein, chloroplastic n=1 Tax=Lactuca sativa TaxID=4236 RepID=UPI0022AEBC5B|nr:thylakoid lumenal 29 kDa protein, chloroplastic [Lactuca sativa]
MELVAGSSPISSPFIEAANAADLIQRRQRSDFQSSIKMTLYKAIKANPELISPLLTLALNDSMTYDKPTKTRGPNGSIRFSSEIERPENKGLSAALSMVEEAKKEIDSYSKGGPISYSDLIQLAGLVFDEDESTLHITELPVRRWTQEYKEFLEVASTAGKDKKPFIEGMVLSEAKKIIDSCMAAKG